MHFKLCTKFPVLPKPCHKFTDCTQLSRRFSSLTESAQHETKSLPTISIQDYSTTNFAKEKRNSILLEYDNQQPNTNNEVTERNYSFLSKFCNCNSKENSCKNPPKPIKCEKIQDGKEVKFVCSNVDLQQKAQKAGPVEKHKSPTDSSKSKEFEKIYKSDKSKCVEKWPVELPKNKLQLKEPPLKSKSKGAPKKIEKDKIKTKHVQVFRGDGCDPDPCSKIEKLTKEDFQKSTPTDTKPEQLCVCKDLNTQVKPCPIQSVVLKDKPTPSDQTPCTDDPKSTNIYKKFYNNELERFEKKIKLTKSAGLHIENAKKCKPKEPNLQDGSKTKKSKEECKDLEFPYKNDKGSSLVPKNTPRKDKLKSETASKSAVAIVSKIDKTKISKKVENESIIQKIARLILKLISLQPKKPKQISAPQTKVPENIKSKSMVPESKQKTPEVPGKVLENKQKTPEVPGKSLSCTIVPLNIKEDPSKDLTLKRYEECRSKLCENKTLSKKTSKKDIPNYGPTCPLKDSPKLKEKESFKNIEVAKKTDDIKCSENKIESEKAKSGEPTEKMDSCKKEDSSNEFVDICMSVKTVDNTSKSDASKSLELSGTCATAENKSDVNSCNMKIKVHKSIFPCGAEDTNTKKESDICKSAENESDSSPCNKKIVELTIYPCGKEDAETCDISKKDKNKVECALEDSPCNQKIAELIIYPCGTEGANTMKKSDICKSAESESDPCDKKIIEITIYPCGKEDAKTCDIPKNKTVCAQDDRPCNQEIKEQTIYPCGKEEAIKCNIPKEDRKKTVCASEKCPKFPFICPEEQTKKSCPDKKEEKTCPITKADSCSLKEKCQDTNPCQKEQKNTCDPCQLQCSPPSASSPCIQSGNQAQQICKPLSYSNSSQNQSSVQSNQCGTQSNQSCMQNQSQPPCMQNQCQQSCMQNQNPCTQGQSQQPCMQNQSQQPCMQNQNQQSCMQNQSQPCLQNQCQQSCMQSLNQQPCMQNQSQQSCTQSQSQQPCIQNQNQQSCMQNQNQQPCMQNLNQQPCMQNQSQQSCMQNSGQQPCMQNQTQQSCLQNQSQQRCPCPANFNTQNFCDKYQKFPGPPPCNFNQTSSGAQGSQCQNPCAMSSNQSTNQDSCKSPCPSTCDQNPCAVNDKQSCNSEESKPPCRSKSSCESIVQIGKCPCIVLEIKATPLEPETSEKCDIPKKKIVCAQERCPKFPFICPEKENKKNCEDKKEIKLEIKIVEEPDGGNKKICDSKTKDRGKCDKDKKKIVCAQEKCPKLPSICPEKNCADNKEEESCPITKPDLCSLKEKCQEKNPCKKELKNTCNAYQLKCSENKPVCDQKTKGLNRSKSFPCAPMQTKCDKTSSTKNKDVGNCDIPKKDKKKICPEKQTKKNCADQKQNSQCSLNNKGEKVEKLNKSKSVPFIPMQTKGEKTSSVKSEDRKGKEKNTHKSKTKDESQCKISKDNKSKENIDKKIENRSCGLQKNQQELEKILNQRQCRIPSSKECDYLNKSITTEEDTSIIQPNIKINSKSTKNLNKTSKSGKLQKHNPESKEAHDVETDKKHETVNCSADGPKKVSKDPILNKALDKVCKRNESENCSPCKSDQGNTKNDECESSKPTTSCDKVAQEICEIENFPKKCPKPRSYDSYVCEMLNKKSLHLAKNPNKELQIKGFKELIKEAKVTKKDKTLESTSDHKNSENEKFDVSKCTFSPFDVHNDLGKKCGKPELKSDQFQVELTLKMARSQSNAESVKSGKQLTQNRNLGGINEQIRKFSTMSLSTNISLGYLNNLSKFHVKDNYLPPLTKRQENKIMLSNPLNLPLPMIQQKDPIPYNITPKIDPVLTFKIYEPEGKKGKIEDPLHVVKISEPSKNENKVCKTCNNLPPRSECDKPCKPSKECDTRCKKPCCKEDSDDFMPQVPKKVPETPVEGTCSKFCLKENPKMEEECIRCAKYKVCEDPQPRPKPMVCQPPKKILIGVDPPNCCKPRPRPKVFKCPKPRDLPDCETEECKENKKIQQVDCYCVDSTCMQKPCVKTVVKKCKFDKPKPKIKPPPPKDPCGSKGNHEKHYECNFIEPKKGSGKSRGPLTCRKGKKVKRDSIGQLPIIPSKSKCSLKKETSGPLPCGKKKKPKKEEQKSMCDDDSKIKDSLKCPKVKVKKDYFHEREKSSNANENGPKYAGSYEKIEKELLSRRRSSEYNPKEDKLPICNDKPNLRTPNTGRNKVKSSKSVLKKYFGKKPPCGRGGRSFGTLTNKNSTSSFENLATEVVDCNRIGKMFYLVHYHDKSDDKFDLGESCQKESKVIDKNCSCNDFLENTNSSELVIQDGSSSNICCNESKKAEICCPQNNKREEVQTPMAADCANYNKRFVNDIEPKFDKPPPCPVNLCVCETQKCLKNLTEMQSNLIKLCDMLKKNDCVKSNDIYKKKNVCQEDSTSCCKNKF